MSDASGAPVMLRQLRHDVWATERLIERCRSLSDEQLDLTAPGTYGTIRKTLAHIVTADENYLVRLLGAGLHQTYLRVDDLRTLDEIASHLGHVREGVERLFARGEIDGERLIHDTPSRRPEQPRIEMYAWVPAAQFVHHGSDPRAQINTVLTVNGLESLDLQVWPYAMDLGATREAKG